MGGDCDRVRDIVSRAPWITVKRTKRSQTRSPVISDDMNRPNQTKPQTNSLSQGSDNIFLKAFLWNAGGLTNEKYTEVKKLLQEEDIDVLGVVEAGASTEKLQYYQIPGYQIYALKRSRQIASGIIVVAKASLTIKFNVLKEMTANDKLEAVRVNIWKNGHHRQLYIAYNPPTNKPDLTLLAAEWNNKSIFYGDLNAPSSRWGYPQTDAVGRIIEDFIDSNPVQYVENLCKNPTFLSNGGYTSHPDVILAHTVQANNIIHTLINPPGGTGHKILRIDLQYPPGHKIHKEPRKTYWNIRKANWEKYTDLTNKIVNEDLIEGSVEKSCESLNSAILKCALEAIPRGQIKKYEPFWNKNLEKLRRERNEARYRAERTRSQSDQVILKQKSAALKRAILQAKRESYKSFLSKLDFRKDGRRAHHFISRLQGDNARNNNPVVFGNKELTCPTMIASGFCKFFAKNSNFVTKKENRKYVKCKPQTCLSEEEYSLFEKSFSIKELHSALHETNKGKSPGPDGILPDFLIYLGDNARKTILKFLNAVWATNYPSSWIKADVVPLLKAGKAANIHDSYRPISLTSAFSKVYERMVLGRLTSHLDRIEYLTHKQAGFRAHRSTMEQIARFTQEVKDGFHRKQHTLAVLVDFKSAFDRVCRKRLLSKLQKIHVRGKLFDAISSFLSQRFIRVKYENKLSLFKQTKQGLPQGAVLSPVLFNIMVNDLVHTLEAIPGVNCLMYADDLIVWATSSHVDALERGLNEALTILHHWADENEMIVNPTKTEYQLFTLSTKTQQVTLSYNGQELPRSSVCTYLGVKLDARLNWGEHISALVKKGEKRLGLLKRLTGIKWGASQDVLEIAYKSYVRPSMEYGAEVIATASKSLLDKLEKQQNKALRLITGGPKSTPIVAMQL